MAEFEHQRGLPQVRDMTVGDLDQVIDWGRRLADLPTNGDPSQIYKKATLSRLLSSRFRQLAVLKVAISEGELAGFLFASFNPAFRKAHFQVFETNGDHDVRWRLLIDTVSALKRFGCKEVITSVRPGKTEEKIF